jgi:uncharacterized protein (DUF849 family)
MTRNVIIMAAPNGARKTKLDHAGLPVSIADTVTEAKHCHAAGASVLHAHVRGANDEHVLDVGLYGELLTELSRQVPEMLIQVTSEAVGVYTPEQQVDCVKAVVPQMSSMALREITSNFEQPEFARQFFDWCDEHQVHLQHIVFTEDELQRFLDYRERGVIPASHRCVLFVLGRYSVDFQSAPADLEPFLQHDLGELDWFCCAFGNQEQACMMAAIDAGGHARVGFENNLYLPNGDLADSTATLISSLVEALQENNDQPASCEFAAQLLDVRSV